MPKRTRDFGGHYQEANSFSSSPPPSSPSSTKHKNKNNNNNNKSCKRPRTEYFLQSLSKYESTMETCTYFQRQICHLNNNKKKNNNNKRSSKEGGRLSFKDDGNDESLQSFENSISKHMLQYKNRFLTTCKELKTEADDCIRLKESFECVSRAIHVESSSSSSLLPMLNQGTETTTVILNLMGDFVGVPQRREVEDLRQLREYLPNVL